jgi:hypothetical protein
MNRERYLTEIGKTTGSEPSDGAGCGLPPGRLRMAFGEEEGMGTTKNPRG